MNILATESYKKYIMVVQKRREMWERLFDSCQNLDNMSEEIPIEDLPLPFSPSAKKSNEKTKKPLNSNDNLSESDDLDTISDTNEDFEDLSEADSEDTAKFSDSDDKNTHPTQRNEILTVYESDSDEELSEDLDENSTNDDATVYLNEICYSRKHNTYNEDSDDASEECSDDEESSENNLCQTHGKRKYSETELCDGSVEEPEFKRQKPEFKNVYINVNESDFETDNE